MIWLSRDLTVSSATPTTIRIVVPPMLTFYNGSNSVEKQMQHIIGKVLMQFGIDYKHFVAWKGED